MCLCGPGIRLRSMLTSVPWMLIVRVSISRCGIAANSAAEPQFVEQAQGAGVHGVAAEIAQEIGVLLHDGDVHTRTGEQQAEHYSRGTAAGDDAGGAVCAVSVSRHPAIFASNSLA